MSKTIAVLGGTGDLGTGLARRVRPNCHQFHAARVRRRLRPPPLGVAQRDDEQERGEAEQRRRPEPDADGPMAKRVRSGGGGAEQGGGGAEEPGQAAVARACERAWPRRRCHPCSPAGRSLSLWTIM